VALDEFFGEYLIGVPMTALFEWIELYPVILRVTPCRLFDSTAFTGKLGFVLLPEDLPLGFATSVLSRLLF
jgi:hypothetical protein